jgi:hypothetical protein
MKSLPAVHESGFDPTFRAARDLRPATQVESVTLSPIVVIGG